MFSTFIWALISVIVVSLISLIGIIFVKTSFHKIQKWISVLVALSVGAMFGDSFIHLLPEALEKINDSLTVGISVLTGIIFFFVLERFLRWHHHHEDGEEQNVPLHIGPLIFTSDFLHNFIDGIIIGASYLISLPVGIATTLAVILHEIPQEIGDFGLLLHAGYTPKKALWMNFLSATSSVLGMILVFVFGSIITITPFIIAFAAGSFIYIAGSDLVPELHKHTFSKKTFVEFGAMILGLVLMLALLLLE
jgi:zinc and cadmium transporter